MRKLSVTLFVSICVLFPSAIFAAHQSGIVPCHGPDCRACDLVSLGQNIIEWLITVMTFVIALVFVAGGFQMVTSGGDSSAVSSAREKMTNAIIGLMIMLLAWLIVDTALKMLLEPEERNGMGPWSEVKCIANPGIAQTPVGGTQTPTGGGTVVSSSQQLTHAQAIGELSGINVVSSGNCSDRTNRSCTSLDGIQTDALTEIKSVVTNCTGCNLQITAGTEVGHRNACHQSGTCVDIDCVGGCSPNQIKTVIQTATAQGSRVVYEVSSQARMHELINAGVPESNVAVVTWITGEHASLYTNW